MKTQTSMVCMPTEWSDAQSDDGGYCDIATLGDEPCEVTCSYDTALRWGRAREIRPVPSFEEGAAAVKRGEVSALLVPGAYPHLNALIFDADLDVRESFVMDIPNMVLAGREKTAPTEVETIFHHPATTPLLSEVPIVFTESVFAVSNSKACKMLLESSTSAVAITNNLCATYFGLTTYRVLRVRRRMPWVVFCRAI